MRKHVKCLKKVRGMTLLFFAFNDIYYFLAEGLGKFGLDPVITIFFPKIKKMYDIFREIKYSG